MSAIELENVAKTYPSGRRALEGVSFQVEEGSVVGILGPNGAGKTTLIRILATLLSPSSGHAAIMGVDVARRGKEARRLLGYVSQDVAVDDFLTGRENLLLQARLHGLTKAEAAARAKNALEQVGLAPRADEPAGTYSGGMRKRLDLASSLLHRPIVLILDEPTLGLDVWSRREMWRAITGLRDETGMTILLSTHYLEEADRLCDEVVILEGGKVRIKAPPSRIKAQAGGDVLVSRLSGSPEDVDDAMSLMRSLPAATGASRVGNELRITVASYQECLPAYIESAKRWRARVDRLTIERRDLADAYLDVTGVAAPRTADADRERGFD